jgi:hypothetical protein
VATPLSPTLFAGPKSRRRARAFLLAAALVFSLSSDVLVARLVTPHWNWVSFKSFKARVRLDRTYRIPSPIYHHALRPMRYIADAQWGGVLHYPLATNSLGFKDRSPRQVPLNATKRRVLFIGDSFTEGVGYAYDQTFVGRIDAALGPAGVDVLNAGVMGYSPSIYYAKIKYLLETVHLSFDEVVVYLDISDAQDEAVSYRLDQQDHVVDAGGSTAGPETDYLGRNRLERFLFNRTLLAKTIVFSLRDRHFELAPKDALGMAVNTRRSAWTFDRNRFDEYGRIGLQSMTANMDRLASLLAAHHIPLTIAVYPWPGQIMFDTTASLQVTHWQRWAERQGAAFLDYFPAFLSPPDHVEVIRRFFIHGDVHWNADGHRFVADRYLEYRARTLGGN